MTIEEYLIHMDKVHVKDLRMDKIPVEEVKMRDPSIRLCRLYIGKHCLDSRYGCIIGYFQYTGENSEYKDRYFTFHFNVRQPDQKKPYLSKKLTSHAMLKYNERWNEWTATDTDFGTMAYWMHTPLPYLEKNGDPEDVALRQLQISLDKYCTKHKLCQFFAKRNSLGRLASELDFGLQ